MPAIQYITTKTLSTDQFIDVLQRSTLAERRPVHDRTRIAKMLQYANILVTAWDGEKLVGVSRAWSDFAFCCYLSDLAVDVAYQKKGIGKELVRQTQLVAGDKAAVILLAAPAAEQYYPKIGMERFEHCYRFPKKD